MWTFIANLASPKKFFIWSSKLMPFLCFIFIISLSYGLIGGLVLAPADSIQGEGFRIIYIHAPCAFLSLFIYAMMSAAAFTGIIFRLNLAFLVLRHSAPLGGTFTFLALCTGSLWGKPMWGTWWIWDARLTSELILLFLYLGILFFQSAIKHKKNADRVLSILVLVGAVDLPIIHYSVYWWNTLHQGATLNLFGPSKIAPEMEYPLLSMMIAFLTYYVSVLFIRMRYELSALRANHHWVMQ